VTCAYGAQRHGATVNSFTAVSLDPPLVLVSLDRRAKACERLADNSFTINVLAANQLDLALHFAGRPQPGARVPWADDDGVPRLRGTAAWVRCRPWQSYDGGDHILFLGEVQRYDTRNVEPLLFLGGEFRRPGVVLYELPRMVALDGQPIPDWVGRLHRLHELSDAGVEVDTGLG